MSRFTQTDHNLDDVLKAGDDHLITHPHGGGAAAAEADGLLNADLATKCFGCRRWETYCNTRSTDGPDLRAVEDQNSLSQNLAVFQMCSNIMFLLCVWWWWWWNSVSAVVVVVVQLWSACH